MAIENRFNQDASRQKAARLVDSINSHLEVIQAHLAGVQTDREALAALKENMGEADAALVDTSLTDADAAVAAVPQMVMELAAASTTKAAAEKV